MVASKLHAAGFNSWLKESLQHSSNNQRLTPCLFLRINCIMVVYNDNFFMFTKDESTIQDVLTSLSFIYKLEDQGMYRMTLASMSLMMSIASLSKWSRSA